MKPMDNDACFYYLVNAYRISPNKDPEAYMECLLCLNPSIKDDENDYKNIYYIFLKWWFTRRDCLTNDLAHRAKRIIDYYDKMRSYLDRAIDSGIWDSIYKETVVIEGMTFNMGVLWDCLRDLIEDGLLKTIDR